jgi:hypothetical protein
MADPRRTRGRTRAIKIFIVSAYRSMGLSGMSQAGVLKELSFWISASRVEVVALKRRS